MLNLKNTLDGYLKNVEVIGNTIQDTNNLANIRSVGDKVEGQELYKIELACYGDNILKPDFEVGLWNTGNGTAQADSTAIRTKGFLRIRNQAHLVKRFDGKLGCQVILFDENFKYLGQQSYAGGSYVRYDNILPNAKYMKINFLNTTDLNLKCVLFDRVPSNINGVEFVEFQESELEILSPVQLEKVGNVADRIICKDGVWGVEKNISTFVINGSETNISYEPGLKRSRVMLDNLTSRPMRMGISDKFVYDSDSHSDGGLLVHMGGVFLYNYAWTNATDTRDWLKANNTKLLAEVESPQFIPLPHDQQVKLRTFAGQTNIAFLTEIPGQIKAQVPKSLGATVNTHTEQIADLHNSLERVKKLEETTVSTVETESSFTTVDATSNGYFEDVKLDGKTLVNHLRDGVGKVELVQDASRNTNKDYHLTKYELNTDYYIIFPNFTPSSANVLSNIYGGFVNGDWLCRVNFKGDSSGVYKIRIDDREPSFFRIYVERGTSEHKLSFDGAMLIPCSEITYEQALELACFEGLMSVGQDVEEVSVKSIDGDGNLFNKDVISKDNEISPKIRVKKGCTISPYADIKRANDSYAYISEYDCNGNILVSGANLWTGSRKLNDNTEYITIQTSLDIADTLTIVEGKVNLTQYIPHQSNKKPLLYYNPTTETWEKPILREWDTIEKHSDGKYYYHKRSGEGVFDGLEADIRVNADLDVVTRFFVAKRLPNCKGQINGKQIFDKYKFDVNFTGAYVHAYIDTDGNAMIFSECKTVEAFKSELQANNVTVVYQLAQEEVYECTNIDLMTYSGETNYIINSGAISPKSLLKVHNNISNVVKILQEKVNLLENTFIAGLKSVLSGDMYSLATILYPEDFEQNDNTEQDIMVIPE